MEDVFIKGHTPRMKNLTGVKIKKEVSFDTLSVAKMNTFSGSMLEFSSMCSDSCSKT